MSANVDVIRRYSRTCSDDAGNVGLEDKTDTARVNSITPSEGSGIQTIVKYLSNVAG